MVQLLYNGSLAACPPVVALKANNRSMSYSGHGSQQLFFPGIPLDLVKDRVTYLEVVPSSEGFKVSLEVSSRCVHL